MKRILISLMFVAFMLSTIMPSCLAAYSQSFTIGATIPAIPGLNAPLVISESSTNLNNNYGTFELLQETTIRNNEEIVMLTYISN